ncbi:hypothetical protein ACIRBY_23420 [Streptomyces sp. NPDC096136]|uniref:hypothetical protein n=1 Tax=Streptomyces sp. NPDC096136 TaxID=3366076 RepID=UPI0037F9ABA8
MNAQLVNSAAEVLHAAMLRGTQTPAGLAVALESAQLLQSPESAAELKRLRARVNELEALEPAPIQTCRTCGAGYELGRSCGTCEFQSHIAAALAERYGDGRPPAEDPHDSPLHHSYRVGRELPEVPRG